MVTDTDPKGMFFVVKVGILSSDQASVANLVITAKNKVNRCINKV